MAHQSAEEVVYRRGGFSLPRGRKRPLGLQAGLQRLKGGLHPPEPLGLHAFYIDLVLPSGLVDGHIAKDDNRQTILGPKLEPPVAPPEHDRAELPPLVLEGKVNT